MSNKIPLEPTLAGAYRFLFTRILSIIGTLWLPFVVMTALLAGIVWLVVPHAWLAGNIPHFTDDMSKEQILAVVMPVLAGIPLAVIVVVVMMAMMMVGLMRLSLGQTPRCYAFFSLGGDVWRLILASILLTILILLLEGVLVLLFGAGMALAHAFMPDGVKVLFLIVLGIVEFCFFVYVAVRWQFFLPAVVVAEHRLGLGRSWELGGGNFWRIVVVALLIYIPVMIVAGIVWQVTMMPILVSEAMRLPDHPDPAEVMAFFQALLPLVPIGLAVAVLQQIATVGLVAGAVGTAYKAVNPVPEEEEAQA